MGRAPDTVDIIHPVKHRTLRTVFEALPVRNKSSAILSIACLTLIHYAVACGAGGPTGLTFVLLEGESLRTFINALIPPQLSQLLIVV